MTLHQTLALPFASNALKATLFFFQGLVHATNQKLKKHWPCVHLRILIESIVSASSASKKDLLLLLARLQVQQHVSWYELSQQQLFFSAAFLLPYPTA